MLAVATAAPSAPIAILLLDLSVIAASALLCGTIARRAGQPAVIGEILAGLLLGPSGLGLLSGPLEGLLFPAAVRPFLTVLGDVALVLFMFGVGFEIDPRQLRGEAAAQRASRVRPCSCPRWRRSPSRRCCGRRSPHGAE